MRKETRESRILGIKPTKLFAEKVGGRLHSRTPEGIKKSARDKMMKNGLCESHQDKKKSRGWRTSLVVQWLRLYYNARGSGLIPGQGTKIPCATAKTQQSQINDFFLTLLKKKLTLQGG